MAKSKKSKLPLFDIRVHAVDENTILLKGSPTTASPTILSGVIALSVTEPFQIRKMKLKLYATLSFNWNEKYHNSKRQTFTHPYKFTKMIYCYDWDPINLENFLNTHNPLQSSFMTSRNASTNSLDNLNNNVGFSTGTLISSNPGSTSNLQRIGSSNTLNSRGSSTSLHRLQSQSQQQSQQQQPQQPQLNSHSRAKSSSSLSAMNLMSLTSVTGGGGGGSSVNLINSSSHEPTTLEPGNYEFPFQVILDGSIPESIIDHPCCSLIYRLQCSIERGRFTTPIYTRKLIHVVRTLSPDNPELSETIAVDNTWPEKIDYSISVPTKAIAIGSTCQVFLDMTPLCKGLRLGSIKIKLIEYGSFSTATGQHVDERTLTTKHIPKITHNSEGVDIWSDDVPIDEDGVFYRSHNIVLSNDKWDVKTTIQLPPSLEKITQDLDISNICKIRHKLKFSVGLINPDGHVSELRATLPITLFISPFVPIKVKTIDHYSDPFQHSTIDDVTIHTNDENIIFKHDNVDPNGVYQALHSNESNDNIDTVPTINMNTQDLMAPPNYDDRIYDRVYDLNSHEDPINSNDIVNVNNINIPSTNTNISNIRTIDRNLTSSRQSSPVREIDVNQSIDDTIQVDKSQENVTDESESADVTVSTADLDPFANKETENKYLRRYKKPIFSIADDDDDEDSDIFDPFDESSKNTRKLNKSLPQSPISNNNVISGPAFESGERMPISRMPSTNHLSSPGTLSPVQHLSRATSFIGGNGENYISSLALSNMHNGNASSCHSSHNGSTLDDKVLKGMLNPPSYEVAIHSRASMKDLTPFYENPNKNDLHSNLHILDSSLKNLRISQQLSSLQLTKTSKSTTSLNYHSHGHHSHNHHLNKRQFGLIGSATNNVPQSPSTPPLMARNVSSTSLLSRISMKHLSNSLMEDNNNSNANNANNNKQTAVRFEFGSPGNQSAASTPGAVFDGYFPLQDVNSNISNTSNNNNNNNNSNNNSSILISPPKAAHFST